MIDFKRVKPKAIANDWEALGEAYRKEREAYMESEAYAELDDPRAWKSGGVTDTDGGYWIKPDMPVLPSIEEVHSFFESVIANKPVAELFFNPAVDVVIDEWGGFKRDFTRLYAWQCFTEWWARTYTDYPVFTLKDVRDKLFSITDQAIIDFLRGRKVEYSYAQMDKEWSFYMKSAQMRIKQVEANNGG